MEVPEYLDLDEIDFSDDAVYSVSSLKNIPELSRRNDAQAEERAAPPINWSRGVASHVGMVGIKPAGATEAHSKFRPVKRVSPLKHHPETREEPPGWDAKVQDRERGAGEARPAAKDHRLPSNVAGGKMVDAAGPGLAGANQGGNPGVLGELEHYDLDMDEILDVPFIKSSGQQMSTLPRALDKRLAGAGNAGAATLERQQRQHKKDDDSGKNAPAQMCVPSPLKWSDLRKSKSLDPDPQHLPRSQSSGGFQHPLHHPHLHHHQEAAALSSSSSLLSGSSSLSSFPDGDKLLSARVYPEAQSHNQDQRPPGLEPPAGGAGVLFPLLAKQDTAKLWGPAGGGGAGRVGAVEVDEEVKKKHNIINIVREGQISLLPHLAADNLSLIRDEAGNNLLHVSASQGHAECLQHLTSLMGEDGLNERNQMQLTPAGLAVKNGHLECVRWMVSETEAIAELSCTRDHPSLIHYAARYGQEKVLLWLLQFMQEQAISLDEVDHNGNTGVHVAAQYGHLTCIQTLVEYGSNVTVLNQQGERPSQLAERQGHSPCARYLVVVETCMSLASQVVKLTKQLTEQAAEKATLQKQLLKLDTSHPSGMEAWPEMMLSVEGTSPDGDWLVRQEAGLRKDSCDVSKAGAAAAGGSGREGARRSAALASTEKREQKLARLKQMMQRSLSESDSDAPPKPDRPTHLPINDEEPASKHLHLVMRKHLPTADRKPISKPVNGVAFSPGEAGDGAGDADAPTDAAGPPKVAATSPKSALKSPSSRRKTAHSLKLRVTFNEQLHQEAEPSRVPAATKEAAPTGSSEAKRPFGALRSIMETLSGNANNNNNNAHNTSHNQHKNKNKSTNV
ncbi:synphilin-1 isoform X5 [Hippocampus comes]|uniref:synphilin-1 isoform X4 n=1 Tax=Hippocampus comes TaxID=109280 RepID=UPI00094E88CD|nr:PREDICTED: synphilin-1 isoform X4 [Hippocampus comes]XP_019721511.1 PREDICTED: synphilin-1 isoform X5 [Hippocampus comes]